MSTKVRPCPECDKVFWSKQPRRDHMRDAHPSAVKVVEPNAPRTDGCTGKTRYPDQASAEIFLVKIRAKHDNDLKKRLPVRAYECNKCAGGWHLTSRPRRIK